MKKSLQKGFGIVEVIFVVLAIILVGFLGWKLYEAQKKLDDASKTDTVQTNSTKSTQKDNLTETATFDAGRKVTLKYPKGWTIEDRESDLNGKIILSPDKDVYILVIASNQQLTGLGGACLPEQTGTIKSISKHSIKSNTEYTLTEVTDSENKQLAEVYKTEGLESAVAGASLCDLPLYNYIILDSKGHLSVSVYPYGSNNNLFKSNNYSTARNIVLSMKVED